MGSVPSRTLQGSETNGKSCSGGEFSTKKQRRKIKTALPQIHIASPTCRRKAAFIKHEKTQSIENIDKNKLWIHWTPRRFSWPNVERTEHKNGELTRTDDVSNEIQ